MATKNLLTIPEVAAILRVPVPRCYDLAKSRILPVVRLGRQLRVDPERLQNWIDRGGKPLKGGWRKLPAEDGDDADYTPYSRHDQRLTEG